MAVHSGGKIGKAGKTLASKTRPSLLKARQARFWQNIRPKNISFVFDD